VEKIELLPFHKLCTTKYEQMGIPFPFGDKPATTKAQVEAITKEFE
jgi:pyruvate formate lyase activating enzyme